MWLFDKIKNGYKRVVNRVLDIAIRGGYIELAQLAIMLGADAFPSYLDDDYNITYPLLARCKSKQMIRTLALGSAPGQFESDQVLLFAVRNDLLSVAKVFIEYKTQPEISIAPPHRLSSRGAAFPMPLILECKSEAMRDLLIDATTKQPIENRSTWLIKCLYWLTHDNLSNTNLLYLTTWANKLLDNGLYLGYQTLKKNNLLHIMAHRRAPISTDIATVFGRIFTMQPSLLKMKNSENLKPIDIIDKGTHAQQWRNFLESRGYITHKYASMKGIPKREHVITESSEFKIFFPTISNKI